MNANQAHRAMQTLEDVYAGDDAVVIACARVSVRNGERGVIVTGHGDGPSEEWWPLSKLTATEDLLRSADSVARHNSTAVRPGPPFWDCCARRPAGVIIMDEGTVFVAACAACTTTYERLNGPTSVAPLPAGYVTPATCDAALAIKDKTPLKEDTMSAANGTIYAKYAVSFTIDRPGYVARSTTVALTTDYTAFEDIRQILAIKHGVTKADIIVTSAALVVDAS